MAKNFPYFKFFPTEWMTGDIVFEDFETQGLFINICALYWQRNADLSIEDINKRFKYPAKLANLTDRFFSVSENKILIKFLDEQLIDAGHISKINSQNGSKGGRPKGTKTLEKKPTANRPQSELKAKKSKEEKELEVNNNIFSFDEFWEIYPNKTAKQKSEQIFKKLKNSELQKIKDTIQKFVSYKPFDSYNFPNPTTYLNQKRFEDIIPEIAKATIQHKQSEIDEARQNWLIKNNVQL